MSLRSGPSSVYSDDSLTSYMGQPTQKKTEGPPKDTFDKCPACMQRFDFLKRATTSLGRVPLILPCKHTVCEICIYRASTSEITSCPVCLEQIPLPHDYKDRLCELFTPHYAVIGYLVWTKNSLPRMSSTLRPTGVTLSGRQSHVSGNGQDTSESDVDDSVAELGELEFKKCLEHSDAYANIHCQTCEMQICCYCFVENHSGHQPVHLYKIDDNAKKELEDFKTAAKCILHQLQATQEKVKGLKTFDVSYVEAAVESTFAALHARLHLAERSFKRDLLSASNSSLLPQHGLGGGGHLGNEIRQSIKKIKKMLSSIDLVQSKQINVKYLLEEVKKAKEIPCRLMCDSGEMEPIRFIINENFDEIENCFTVNKNFGQEYRLVPLEDAQFKQNLSPPESVKTIKSRKTSSSASQIKVELKFGPPTPLSKITDNPPVQTSNSSKQTSKQTSQRNRKDHIKRVIVTHLNDLNSFYVQDVADNSKLTLLNKKLLKAVNEGPTGPIVKDRVYAVLYVSKKDMVWRRAKILKILNEDEEGGADSEPQYFVLYIDYGNTQLVSKDKIKSLNLALSNQDPLATECKLINPMGKQSWPDNAKLDFAQIVADKELLLRSSGSSGDMILEVDLLVPDSAGDHISIIKILLEQCRPADNEAGRADSSFTKLKFFENSKTFRLEQVEYVNITHIDDPDNICVQLVSNESAIQQIKSDLKKLYSGSGATAAVSCVPVVGTDVVVNYKSQLHGNWHRSRVRSLDYASKMADVFFVDWGATATVPWSSIKLLTEEVVKLESQAIFVKLADVAPKQTNKWSQHASNYLRDELIHDPTSFKIAVSRVAPLEVALFKITREADVCINALLVENGFAISTGKISETVEWLHEPKKPEKLKDDNLSSQILKKSEQTVLTSTEEEAEDPDDRFRQQVTVSRCHGPDLIYVKFLANKKKEEQMYKELQIYYNNAKNRIAKTEWPVNKECVVWDKKHHQHVRAWVKEKITDTTYLVCLYDQARDLIVPVKSMYVYAAYFKKYLCFTYKCHLGNIKPAGDSGKWSQLAHEILQKMFDTYKTVYLRKIEGDNVDRSMCVIMWYVLTLAGNALEPSKVSYIQINKVLVESGVAFNSTSSAAAIATAPPVVVLPGNAASSSTTQSLVAKENIKVEKRTEGDVNSEGDSDSSAATGKTKKTLKSKKEGKQQQQQTRELNEDGLDSDTARIIGGLMPPVDSDEETNGRRANVNDIADAMVTAGDKMLQNIERVRDWNVLMEAEDAQGGDMMVIQQTTTTIMGHLNVDREGNVYADFNPDIRYDYGEGEARYHDDATTSVVPPREADESSAPGTGANEDEPPAITNWLPPLPLKAIKCHTILKCIDDDGIFYVRDVQLDALYMDMEKRLKEFFDGANLPAERIHWSPGDMCTIHWENDYWYRGSVLMYEPGKDDNISVEMIDFGSSHLVTWEQLRKQVMYPDLPPFVNKVQMYGIAPRSGHWIKDDIDVMMDNVTDELLVDVKSGFDTDIPSANIYLSTGQLFNRLVCQLLPHVRRIILDEFDEDMDDTPTGRQNLAIILGEQYEYCPLPYTGDGRIKMRVVNFSKYDTVILDVLDSDEEHAGKLATLDAEFQKESALQPELSGGSVDKDTLCMCRMKARGNKWSRAVVDDVTNLGYGYVTVLFVDYGLLDMVPIADLKPVKPEWRALPVANQVASLNIGLLASNQSDLVMAQMKELCGKTVSVEVLSKNPLLVHLYDENQPDTLCYQFLVNCRMISLL